MAKTVTVFNSIVETKEPIFLSVDKVFLAIQTGGRQRTLIESIRVAKDKEARERLKKELGCVLFSGRFSERRADALIEYSRLICIEYDGLPDPIAKKAELIKNPYVYATWLSPSATGLRVLVQVSTDNHSGHFAALMKEFPGCDPSTKDVSRIMFHSYDPDIYINRDAEIFTKLQEEAKTDSQGYANLKKWLENKGEHFVEGNRNNFITKLAGAANRFGIDRDFLIEAVIDDYVSDSDFSRREAENTISKIYDRYSAVHATQSFEETYSENQVNEILSDEIPTNDIIYVKDVEIDLLKDFDEGTQKAPTTYFPSIDEIYRPMRGDLNVLTGVGNYGKSAMQKQMDLVRAVKEGMKFAYHSREEYPPMFWYRELIRSYVGKPVERNHPNRMTRKEYKEAMEFMHEHFIYIYPPKLPTPQYIIERFAEAVIKHSIDGCVVDPWNQLLHVMDKRDDIYLGEALTEFELFAQQHNVYMTIIAHPNRTGKKQDGNYECPDVYDLNGGPVWNARATNICAYHRPFYQTDKADVTCEFHSKKIKKQMLSGVPGSCTLMYDRVNGRFYDQGFSPLD